MFGNYLRVSLRSFLRQKLFSLVNIFGLALSMACCTMILLLIQHEISFDKFHENGDNLYVVAQHAKFGSRTATSSTTAPALVPILVDEYPEIIKAARYKEIGNVALSSEDCASFDRGHGVDPEFFEMFSFPFVSGNPHTALSDPYSIVLTEELAKKYFGDTEPLGSIVTIDGNQSYNVTGIVRDIPANSTIHFDFVIPFNSMGKLWNDPGHSTSWVNWSTTVYVMLQEGTSYKKVSGKIADRIERADENTSATLFLAPYTRLHLYGLGFAGGGIVLVTLFSLIGSFILVIACMNYMNLATAQSAGRVREIGLRKINGASRGSIIFQIYGESFLMSFISLLVAVALIEVLLPVFNNLVGRQLTADFLSNWVLSLGLVGVAVLTATAAGFYPALTMSLFQPVRMLKGGSRRGSRASGFRKTLVVIQFVLSVFLIIVSVVIFKQVGFLRTTEVGFDKDHLVYFQLRGEIKNSYKAVKQELLQCPELVHVSTTSRTPLGIYTNGSNWDWEGKAAGDNLLITYLFSDVDFPETFDIDMADGRYYRKEHTGRTSVSSGEVVVNETLARILGVEDPIGARISNYGQDFTIVGVIKDFHFKPLHQRIEPLILFLNRLEAEAGPDRCNYMFARIRPGNTDLALAHIEEVHERFSPEFPFVLRFYDEANDRLYAGSERTGKIIRYAAGVAILISCLGLFGLAAFTTEQRTKEIGIRKVLGASVTRIVELLCREFLLQVVIANVIGGALAFMIMSGWLQNFAYRTPIGWEPFALAITLTLLVGLLSISSQAIKAAVTNPTETLRHE